MGKVEFRTIFFKFLSYMTVVILAIIAVSHILLTPWANIYFYNGDSLTLPLLAKSMVAGEDFRWHFSSQLFFFPEGLLHGICYAITPSIVWSLIANSFLNIIIFHALLFFIAKSIGFHSLKNMFFAITGTAFIVLYIVLEPYPDVNRTALVSLSLFNTYYFGVILSSLLLLMLTILIIQRIDSLNTLLRSRNLLLLIAVVGITSLTYCSNPLLVLQFSLPFLASILVMLFLKWLHAPAFKTLLFSQIVGLLLGQGLRLFFIENIGRPTNRYIDITSIFKVSKSFFENLLLIKSSYFSLAEYTIILLILLFSVFSIFNLASFWRSKKFDVANSKDVAITFLLLFAILSPIITVAGTIASGNFLMRYFFPVVFFPLLSLIFLFYHWPQLIPRNKTYYTIYLFCMPVLIFLISKAVLPGQEKTYLLSEPIDCYNRHMEQLSFNVVGGFWTSRQLDLYGNTGSRALQVNMNLEPFLWLNNAAPFSQLKLNGVIVDKLTGGIKIPDYIYAEDVAKLGPYSKKFSCNKFDIYYYADGSKGFLLLNAFVKK